VEDGAAGLGGTVRCTASQALVRWMTAQHSLVDGMEMPYFGGVWAIFGHGNVAGMGAALAEVEAVLPTFRAHSEQGMAHAAIAFAKAHRRERAMACTTSIGPGATNLVTAAAVAHANRLPILLLPGDVFASRRPDPVLQQIEAFHDASVSANDCLRPVSRLFDRITRPEQLIDALPRAMGVLTDPAQCGPVTIALCQDVQAETFDFPAALFRKRLWRRRRSVPDAHELAQLVARIRAARAPLIVAGGGVLYARAEAALAALAEATGVPVAETQAGKGALAWDHPQALGAIGVTGGDPANKAAAEADLILGIGTRLQDFTTGSRRLFARGAVLAQVNVAAHDAGKHDALPVLGDAGVTLALLTEALGDWRVNAGWEAACRDRVLAWNADWEAATAPDAALPSDAQVIGALWPAVPDDAVVLCAAGGLPGELHKLWRVRAPGGYHAEYGFSCMGYEIAGGLGAKLAMPERDVVVMVGDGSYLMLNSELATSVAMGLKLIVVLLDNGGFGCIHRLQQATGGQPFGNLRGSATPAIDFAAHARSLGAHAVTVDDLRGLGPAVARALAADRSTVLVLRTDPDRASTIGGHWWDVPAPGVSGRAA
jgi:3D-(3,5/4)-trihydroxycyclohexane-1,2-dione acylhydrolase (decyclizing)